MFAYKPNIEFNQRLKKLYAIKLQDPRFQGIFNQFDEMRIAREVVNDPSAIPHMLIVALSGSGKTFWAKQYARLNSEIIKEGQTIIPVAYCPCPHPFRLDGFYFRLLQKLKAEYVSPSWKEKQLREQAIRQLQNAQTEILFLDEIQHIFSMSRKGKEGYDNEIMDTLKDIANTAGVCLVCLGKPDAASLRNDLQVFRRFEPFAIHRFQFNDSFFDILSRFEAALGLQHKSGLAENKELARIIYDGTMGIFDYVRKLLIESAKMAIKQHLEGKGPEKINKKIITEATKSKLAEFDSDMRNNVLRDEKWITEFLIKTGRYVETQDF